MASPEIRILQRVVALVTGGASGLGRATAARLVRQGAAVVIADLPSSKGSEVAEEIGEKATFVPTDVSTCLLELYASNPLSVSLNIDSGWHFHYLLLSIIFKCTPAGNL